jgi:tetratricopeptide (TPR) repeat protein
MRRDRWIGLILAILTLGVYWPVRTHDFIYYDDSEFILENPQIQSGLNWNTLVYAFSRPVVGNWHPITTLSHALDCELFGLKAGNHHLMNALLHAANTLLLFVLLQRWRRDSSATSLAHSNRQRSHHRTSPGEWLALSWPGLLVTLLFALHPLRVESVAWVAERKDVLSGFFFLLTLGTYTLFVEEKRLKRSGSQTRRSARWTNTAWKLYLLTLAAFALGLMSKPMLVTVPFVLLLIDYWPFHRFEISNFKSVHSNPRPVASLFVEKLPFLFLSLIDCWITLAVQKHTGAMQVIERVTLSERSANAVTSYLRYLGKFFCPADLAIVYPHPSRHYFLSDQWPLWEIVLGTLLLVLITVLCILQARRRPYLAVGWFWFVGMLFPVIGLVQVGEQAMADRYTYLPLLGPAIALAWWLSERVESDLRFSRLNVFNAFNGRPVCGTVFLLLAAATVIPLTRHQLSFWQDTITLFQHAVAVTADNPSAQFALGVGLEKEGQPGKAMVRYRIATAIDPRYGKAWYNMGQLLRKSGQWQAAAESYLAANRANPHDLATHLNLAGVLARLGKYRQAVQLFDDALKIDPNSIEGLNNLAWLLSTAPEASVRDGGRAVTLAERGCSLTEFKMPVLLGTLGAAYAESGRFAEAAAAAERACAAASQSGDTATASKNQELLALYRANRAYRETNQ